MTTDRAADVVPFGKYKGQPVEALVADADYRDWLLSQPWFRDRWANVYQVIVNYGAEPTETPEHNELQLSFLKDERCLRLARHLFPAETAPIDVAAATPRKWAANIARFKGHLSMTTVNPKVHHRKFEDHGWDVTYVVSPETLALTIETYPPCSCGPCAHKECSDSSSCRGGRVSFICGHLSCASRKTPPDRNRYDSSHHKDECPWAEDDTREWFADFWPDGDRMTRIRHVADLNINVECKPDLGDDFPAVLRQVKKYRGGAVESHYNTAFVVLARRHAFESVTFEQVREMFAASNVRLVREEDL